MEQQRAIKPVAIQKKPVDELIEFIGRATEFTQWLWILDRLIALAFGVPSKALYDAIQKCPAYFSDSDRKLRIEIFEGFRTNVLESLTTENIAGYERKFMTLIQASSFVGRAELLRAKVLVTLAYKTANLPVPLAVKERLAGCERFHREQLEKKGHPGSYDADELEYAGYALKFVSGTLETWVHPETKDSITRSTNVTLRHNTREEGRRQEKRSGAEAMFAHAERKNLVLNRAGQLIEVRKHKPIVALSPEERRVREQAAEAERKHKAEVAEAKKNKEKNKKKDDGKKKK